MTSFPHSVSHLCTNPSTHIALQPAAMTDRCRPISPSHLLQGSSKSLYTAPHQHQHLRQGTSHAWEGTPVLPHSAPVPARVASPHWRRQKLIETEVAEVEAKTRHHKLSGLLYVPLAPAPPPRQPLPTPEKAELGFQSFPGAQTVPRLNCPANAPGPIHQELYVCADDAKRQWEMTKGLNTRW